MIIPVNVKSAAGIKRDGTRFEGGYYVDGQWCRFQRGLPRKIGGYKQISNYANGIIRQFHTQALDNFVYTHIGQENGVQKFTIDNNGNTSAPVDRTPLTFTPNDNYNWMFDAMQDGAGSTTLVFAHAVSTLLDISDGINYPIYYGDIYDNSVLTEVPTPGVCGGIVTLHPYLFAYCKNGYVKWSDANDPTNFTTGDAGDAFIASSKVVKGLPLRGGSQAPAGLFWTLDSVIRASYTGGDDIFTFDTITASTSVLATNGIIEYDGIFYWCGLDRFMLYNGTVRDVPNDLNINFFFDNLNFNYANKVFAFKVPRFGEIWWCFPKGTSTECNHALIFNVRENTWYDTALPDGGRSAGIYAQVFRSPLMGGVDVILPPTGELRITEGGDTRITENGDFRITDTGESAYKVWRHEVGVDVIDGSSVNAIQSYFETGDISMLTTESPKNRGIRCELIEPDFVQSGDMSVQITGRINARAPEVTSAPRIFPAVATYNYQEPVYFREQRREMRFRFESNTVGGDYQLGQTIAHIELGDGRFQS
jgi:hypothetical protein